MYPATLSELDVVLAAGERRQAARRAAARGRAARARGCASTCSRSAMSPGKLRKHADDRRRARRVWLEAEHAGVASLWLRGTARRHATSTAARIAELLHARTQTARGEAHERSRSCKSSSGAACCTRRRPASAQLEKHLADAGPHRLRRLRPDAGQPDHRQPRPDQAADALAARRAQADRADGRRHGADRRSVGQGRRAHAADARRDRGERRRRSARIIERLLDFDPQAQQPRADREQRRLARASSASSRCCATSASTSRSTR